LGEAHDYDYHSQDGAQVTTSISASGTPVLDAVVQGNLGMHIGFSRAGAFVLKAGAVTVRRMAELADIDEQILRRYRDQRWRPGWVVVTEVARGGPSITVVSGSSAGEAVIDLGAAVGPAGPVLGAGFAVRSTKGLAASFVALTEAALLWRGRSVQDRWWSSEPRLRDRGVLPDEGGWPGGGDDAVTDHGVTDHGVTDHGVTDHGVTGDGVTGDAVPQVVDIEYPEDLPSHHGGLIL